MSYLSGHTRACLLLELAGSKQRSHTVTAQRRAHPLGLARPFKLSCPSHSLSKMHSHPAPPLGPLTHAHREPSLEEPGLLCLFTRRSMKTVVNKLKATVERPRSFLHDTATSRALHCRLQSHRHGMRPAYASSERGWMQTGSCRGPGQLTATSHVCTAQESPLAFERCSSPDACNSQCHTGPDPEIRSLMSASCASTT